MSSPPPEDFYKAQAVPPKPMPGEARTSGKAIASLVFGLLTPFLCGIPGIVALIMGMLSLSEIRNSNGQLKGRGMATTGIVFAAVCFTLMLMVVPVLLLLPAINAAREAARRNGCLNNTRQLALAAANHEAATQRFPLASDAAAPLAGPGAAIPASVDDDGRAAGYSWQVKLLPFVEERMLFEEIKQSSQNMTPPAFDPSIQDSFGGHPAQRRIVAFVCPSFAGDMIATAPEYRNGLGDVAVGNYVALPGTNLKADGTLEENGIIVSKWGDGSGQFKGCRIREIGDGVSKTIILCESREQDYGSWYDGQAAWVTALKTDITENDFKMDMRNRFPEPPADSTALNVGGEFEPYFPAARYAGQQARLWGPSSVHSGSVVLHAFADAHAKAIASNIDPAVYMSLITRGGGERISPDDF